MNFTVEQARKYAGLTQEETAEKMGISRDSYRFIEKNPGRTTIDQAYQFSGIVGIPVDQIFFSRIST